MNVNVTIKIRSLVSKTPKHFRLAMASRRAAFSGNISLIATFCSCFLFFCTVTDFSAGALPIGVKFYMALRPHLRQVFSTVGGIAPGMAKPWASTCEGVGFRSPKTANKSQITQKTMLLRSVSCAADLNICIKWAFQRCGSQGSNPWDFGAKVKM